MDRELDVRNCGVEDWALGNTIDFLFHLRDISPDRESTMHI
jgi:hypothetical protein